MMYIFNQIESLYLYLDYITSYYKHKFQYTWYTFTAT